MFYPEQPRITEARTCEYRMPSSCRMLSESFCRVRFFAVGGAGGLFVDAAAAVLDCAPHGLGRGADAGGAFRSGLRARPVVARALEVGRVVRWIHRGLGAIDGGVGPGPGASISTHDARVERALLEAVRLVRDSRGRLADRSAPYGCQRTGAPLCWPGQDRAAGVSHHALAHGMGIAVGLSHGSGHFQRTAASGTDAA